VHHLPADLQVAALREMRRVLRPGGVLLVADAQMPRALGWRLLAAVTGHLHMAQMTPELEALAAQAGFDDIRTGEAPPWLRYVRAARSAIAAPPAGGERLAPIPVS
jgi:SAM-dependent methyltransferase